MARRARLRGLPVTALAGTIVRGVDVNFELLRRAAEDALRMVAVGMHLRAA